MALWLQVGKGIFSPIVNCAAKKVRIYEDFTQNGSLRIALYGKLPKGLIMISFKRLAQAFIFTFALLAYYPQEVSSQVRSASVVQLRQEYNLLTQKIESAKQLFGNSSSQKIRILIQEAEKRQSEALRYW
ncbi:MAG: hypothetical protein DWQ10_02310, partial [Calditrichaeota bacterium]